MLTNSRNELSVLVSKVSSGLTSLQISACRASPGELPEPGAGEQPGDLPRIEGSTED